MQARGVATPRLDRQPEFSMETLHQGPTTLLCESTEVLSEIHRLTIISEIANDQHELTNGAWILHSGTAEL